MGMIFIDAREKSSTKFTNKRDSQKSFLIDHLVGESNKSKKFKLYNCSKTSFANTSRLGSRAPMSSNTVCPSK